MPEVVQHSLSDAQAVLSKAGVRSTARRRDGGVPAASDIVLWQFPLPKKKVTVGTAGVLYVVQRPVPPPVKPTSPQPEELTPPVIGLSSNDASALLKLRELKPSWTAVPSPDTALGSVIGQAPLPGRPIRKDRSIDLQIAGVPQVVGLAADAAAARLARAHLAST